MLPPQTAALGFDQIEVEVMNAVQRVFAKFTSEPFRCWYRRNHALVTTSERINLAAGGLGTSTATELVDSVVEAETASGFEERHSKGGSAG
jgi:hypothetical protein